jgi:hypothetical protein
MTNSFAAIAALGISRASPVLIWSVTRAPAATPGDRARLFGEVFVVTVVALVLTRFAVIPLLRQLDVILF